MQTPGSSFLINLPRHLAVTLLMWLVGLTGPGALAATFIPDSVELNAAPNLSTEQQLDVSRMEVQVDSSGRSFYGSDDRRYPAENVGLDSAFTGNRWPGGVVHYQFDPAVTTANRTTWRAAAVSWSAVAALTFVESTAGGNYISVHNSSGNNSYVGMIGGAQDLNISDWYQYVIAHEIGHALGMEHEQSRADRNSFVSIYLNNVEAGQASNFDRISTTVNYGAYDFESIMHYERLAFSRNGMNTIAPVAAYSSHLYTMGRSTSLTALDKAGMAQRYPHSATIGNDFFVNRTILEGSRGTVNGNTFGASKEAGEPNHVGNPGGASVWFTWSPGFTGVITFDTYGSDYDTLLAVYTGNSVTQLSYVASNDDTVAQQSRVSFMASAGTTYQIAVDGYSGGSGNFRLHWGPLAQVDFNSDSKSDLVWQNSVTGQRAVWMMNGTARTAAPALPTVAKQWQIVGTGEFNGDGHPDLVWQDSTTGQSAIWQMDGTSLISTQSYPSRGVGWEIACTGDLNGDGQVDLIWQNNATGERSVWFMSGTAKVGDAILPTVSKDWRIAGTGDFNNDGSTDLVWENRNTGWHSVWFMNGTSKIGDRTLAALAAPWQMAGTGDFNNDGLVDFIWQNASTGQRSIWFMNGTTQTGSAALPIVSTQWQIRNH